MPHHNSTLDAIVRLGLSLLLALPVGWERERSRSGGLRTYPLLSVCICGFLLVAQSGALGPIEQADVFFGVLSGIGFVGSGAVMKSPDGSGNMSTTVSLWVTGAIGAGAAYGALVISAALSAMCIVGLWGPSLFTSRRT
jgi:putative Mg2+ transporter-C (MgtC) family protein